MDEIERKARQLAANKMGLLNDVKGECLPDELWRQRESEARIAYYENARAEALGSLLGMVDAMLVFHDNGLDNMVAGGWAKLHLHRDDYTQLDKALRDARIRK